MIAIPIFRYYWKNPPQTITKKPAIYLSLNWERVGTDIFKTKTYTCGYVVPLSCWQYLSLTKNEYLHLKINIFCSSFFIYFLMFRFNYRLKLPLSANQCRKKQLNKGNFANIPFVLMVLFCKKILIFTSSKNTLLETFSLIFSSFQSEFDQYIRWIDIKIIV